MVILIIRPLELLLALRRHTDGSKQNMDTQVNDGENFATTYVTHNEDGTIGANHQEGKIGNDPSSTTNTVISSTGVSGTKYKNNGSVEFQTSEGKDIAEAPEKVINITRYNAHGHATNSSLIISPTGYVEQVDSDDNILKEKQTQKGKFRKLLRAK